MVQSHNLNVSSSQLQAFVHVQHEVVEMSSVACHTLLTDTVVEHVHHHGLSSPGITVDVDAFKKAAKPGSCGT